MRGIETPFVYADFICSLPSFSLYSGELLLLLYNIPFNHWYTSFNAIFIYLLLLFNNCYLTQLNNVFMCFQLSAFHTKRESHSRYNKTCVYVLLVRFFNNINLESSVMRICYLCEVNSKLLTSKLISTGYWGYQVATEGLKRVS